MAFRKKVDFLQKERDELPQLRPVIIFITTPPDATAQTSQYKNFKTEPNLPSGVLKREKSPINFCLIEADSSLKAFKTQLSAALEEYKDAPHKEIVLNALGSAEGILLSKEGEEAVLLTGSYLAELVLPHTHGHFLHVLAFTSYGHVFAEEFCSAVKSASSKDQAATIAFIFFTSVASPTAWDKVAISGSGHVEVTRDLKEYIKTNIEPNTPYKMVDTRVAKAGCVIL